RGRPGIHWSATGPGARPDRHDGARRHTAASERRVPGQGEQLHQLRQGVRLLSDGPGAAWQRHHPRRRALLIPRLDGMRYHDRHASAVLVLVWLPVRVPDGRLPGAALTEAT